MALDPAAVADLVGALAPEARNVRIESIVPLAGGWSTDTQRVLASADTAAGEQELDLVVRRVPEDGLLAPYDIEREHRILVALQGSPVPVPRVLGCDPNGKYIGSPCLVTAFVSGEPLTFFGQFTGGDDARLPAYFRALASVHSLDWAAHGLDFLDDADDAIEAELTRAERRLEYHGCAGPEERAMLDWLRANKPPDMTRAFLHGDPNPANYLFGGPEIAAILDWELALIGDPRIDLGFFAAIQTAFAGAWALDAGAFARGYAEANQAANLVHLDYFEAVGLFRLAGFLHAAERLRATDVSALRLRLRGRFEQIAAAV